jgi:HPt (histidine-containing phosphotransfer) domain-containing protein
MSEDIPPINVRYRLRRYRGRRREVKIDHANTVSWPSAAPVDLEALRVLVDGDAVFARELIRSFIDSGTTALQEIAQALASEDERSIADSAHLLKGAGATIQAAAVSLAAGRLEAAARSSGNEPLAMLTEELHHEMRQAIQYLQASQA